MTAHVITLCNQKGGVGKTTTTFHLARAAVLAGRRVLVVDADPQGNLTIVTARQPVDDDQVGLADVLSARTPETVADVTVPGIWPGLDLAPTAGTTLAAVRDELVVAGAGREGRLREALTAVSGRYDLILIDCAPALDQLTINALAAADDAVVVTQSKLFSANGLAQLLDNIDTVRRHYNPQLAVAGILVNQHEARTVSGKGWIDELEAAAEARGLAVFNPPIPKNVVISDAAEAARGLDQWGTVQAAILGEIYAAHLAAIETGARR